MHPVAEGQVLVHVVTHHVELIWIREHGWVTVGRAIPHDDLLILGNALPRDFRVFHGSAAHVHDRRHHTQRLMGHPLD